MVDEQCELAKQKMKEKPAAEFGSFQNAVTTADGAWLTRGHHSQNFTYKVRDYMTSALLYYQHLCQRGNGRKCKYTCLQSFWKMNWLCSRVPE